MATTATTAVSDAESYQAIVDMGRHAEPSIPRSFADNRLHSNGIRFSISDLKHPTARVLPVVYHDRCSISLYDAQYSNGEKEPISAETMEEVVGVIMRFQHICNDFGVPPNNTRIVATEATREAINSREFTQEIRQRTGWIVDTLPKAGEGRYGALGVASSFESLNGLVMDMGGGSVQLTLVNTDSSNRNLHLSGSVSLPYGAAELTRRLLTQPKNAIVDEMTANLKSALRDLKPPQSIEEHGIDLYVCGGGFRASGYILMSHGRIQPYPFPMINGFSVSRAEYTTITGIQAIDHNKTFRISSRRASQVEAIAVVVSSVLAAFPSVENVLFAQGGLREGLLFDMLPQEVRIEHPLIASTKPYAPRSALALFSLISSGTPNFSNLPIELQPICDINFLASAINMMYYHASLPKDIRALAALHCTKTGILASAHGLSHFSRALLALVLYDRWGGEIPEVENSFLASLQALVGPNIAWWAKYIGRLIAVIAETYPAGLIRVKELWFELSLHSDTRVQITIARRYEASLTPAIKDLEKVGKRKNWIGDRQWGSHVEVSITPLV